LPRYFSATANDAYTAREIINGDKATIPSWSYGQSIGSLIAGYHQKFLSALDEASASVAPQPAPEEIPTVTITTTGAVKLIVNGEALA